MRSIELFAGIGGIALAAEWAGIETVAFCEREPFAQKVLNKHWPDVPIFDDVCTLNRKALEEKGVIEPGGTVDIISGGFPCQPFSVAGKQGGKDDDRDLWPEMFRIIKELRPAWVVGENVANFVRMELDRTIINLESLGYSTRTFVIPACAVNAKHRRNRTFIVAHSNSIRMERRTEESVLRKRNLPLRQVSQSFSIAERRYDTFKSRLCRTLHGIPNGVDRVRALGNAVVPQQIYPIFKAIVEIEKGELT